MPVFKNKKIKGGKVVPVENGRPEHVKDTPYNDEQEIEYYLEFARKKNLGNEEIASNKNGTHFTMCGNLEMNIEKDGVALRSNKYKLGCGEIVELLSDFYNKFDEDERNYLNAAVSSRRSTLYPVSWESVFFKKMPTVKRTFVADETHAQTDIQQPILFIDKDNDVFKTGVKQTGWYFWNGDLDFDSPTFVRDWEYNTELKEFVPVIETEFLNDTSLENVLFNGKYYNFFTDHEAATQAKKSLLFELYFYKNVENQEKLYFDTRIYIQQYTLLVEQLTAKKDEPSVKIMQQNLDEKIKLFEDLNSENNTTKRYLLSVTSFDEERNKIIRELSKAKRQEQDEEGSFLNIFGFGSRNGQIQRIKLEAEKKILEHKNELRKFEIEQQRRQQDQTEEEERRRLALLSVQERISAKRILEELPDKLKQENEINAQNRAKEREEASKIIKLERQRKQKEEETKIEEEQNRLAASQLSFANGLRAIESITEVATRASDFAATTQNASIDFLKGAASSAASSIASNVLPAAQYVGLAPPTLSKEANEVDLDEVDRIFKEQLEKDNESTSSEFTRQPLQQNKTSQGIGQHFKLPLSNQYGHIGRRVSASAIRRLGASPIPKVRASPIRRVGARIGARVGASPIRKVGSSPIRKVGTSPIRKVGTSPIRKVGASPIRKVGIRVGASPIRRVNASGIRRRIGASSINRRIR
jgi:hypothetical protein